MNLTWPIFGIAVWTTLVLCLTALKVTTFSVPMNTALQEHSQRSFRSVTSLKMPSLVLTGIEKVFKFCEQAYGVFFKLSLTSHIRLLLLHVLILRRSIQLKERTGGDTRESNVTEW